MHQRSLVVLGLGLVVLALFGAGCGGKTSEWGQWIHTDSGSHAVGLTTSAGSACLAYFGGSRRSACEAFYNLYPSPSECGFSTDDSADRCAKVCGPDATCTVSPLSPGGITCTSTLPACTSCSIAEAGHLSDGCARQFWVSPTLAACGVSAPLDAAACASICGNSSDSCSVLATDDQATTVSCWKQDPTCPAH